MGFQIQDGTGTKLKLKVTNANRALVQSVIITEEDDAITRGEGYQIASGTQSLQALLKQVYYMLKIMMIEILY